MKLAVVSCSHFETGYFNAYEAIAAMDDINAVVHLYKINTVANSQNLRQIAICCPFTPNLALSEKYVGATLSLIN